MRRLSCRSSLPIRPILPRYSLKAWTSRARCDQQSSRAPLALGAGACGVAAGTGCYWLYLKLCKALAGIAADATGTRATNASTVKTALRTAGVLRTCR